jgi:hypothetical protein
VTVEAFWLGGHSDRLKQFGLPCPLLPDSQKFHKKAPMSNSQDHSRNLFLEYYEDYIDAKDKKQPLKTWLKAVHCREQLQKIGDPSNEAQTCQDLFAEFVTKEQAAKIYRDLYEDSRSYPGS